MAIAVRQIASNAVSNATSNAASFSLPTLAGSVVAIGGLFGHGSTTVAFSNDKGDSFTDSGLGLFTGDNFFEQMGAFLAATAGSQAYTITLGAQQTFLETVIWEITGLTSPSFDVVGNQKASTATTGTSMSSGSTGTLSSANEIALGYLIPSSNYNTGSQGAGWTDDGATSGFNHGMQHDIVSSTSPVTCIGTQVTSGSWDCWCITLLSSASAPAATPSGLIGMVSCEW